MSQSANIVAASQISFPADRNKGTRDSERATQRAMADSADAEGDRYFKYEDTPNDLVQTKKLVDEFVEFHRAAQRRVVLVTVCCILSVMYP